MTSLSEVVGAAVAWGRGQVKDDVDIQAPPRPSTRATVYMTSTTDARLRLKSVAYGDGIGGVLTFSRVVARDVAELWLAVRSPSDGKPPTAAAIELAWIKADAAALGGEVERQSATATSAADLSRLHDLHYQAVHLVTRAHRVRNQTEPEPGSSRPFLPEWVEAQQIVVNELNDLLNLCCRSILAVAKRGAA
jgi:hypothetical protein